MSEHVPIVTLSDEDSESDSDIDILEDLSKHSSSNGNNNIAEVDDDSNDSDEIQFLEAVEDTDIQVLKQIHPKEDSTDIEIIDEKSGCSAAQTSSQSYNKLPQTVSPIRIKQELIKTESECMTIDDDNDEFVVDNVVNDFDNKVTVMSDEITPTEIIDHKSNVDDGSNDNDKRVNDNCLASIVEKCDHMSIETSDQTVDKDIKVVVEEKDTEEEEKGTSYISELVTDLNLKDDNNDKNISAVIEEIISTLPVLNEPNHTILGIDLDVDSCLSSNTDVCDTSFEITVNNDNINSGIDSSSYSVINTTITDTIPNHKSSNESGISVDNTTTHPKKSLIPSDMRPKPKCKKKKAEDRYECLKCSFVTYNLVNLIYHNSEHRNTFKCKHQLCSYQTNTKDKLERHFTKHDSMRKMCLPCMKQTMLCDCGECDQSRTSVV